MSITTTLKWSERFVIILSALALLVTFISLPNTPSSGWGWFVLAAVVFALGSVVLASFVYQRNSLTHEGNFFLSHVNASSLWLAIRVYLGSVWLQAGLSKLFDPTWIHGGLELKGFWIWATLPQPGPHPEIAYPWYRDLLQFMLIQHAYTWFAWVIALSELTVGILLILGLFTGLAAFAGAGLNLLYLLAGSAGINPVMLILSLFLLMAWKVAGYYGLDRVVLPITTSWIRQIARIVRRHSARGTENGANAALPVPTAAMSLNEMHGFE